jgi:glycosyltransferase involved in cell wall biosynthesis
MDEVEDMKILVVSYKFPFPIRDGGDYSIRSFAKMLSENEMLEVRYIGMNLLSDKRKVGVVKESLIASESHNFVEVDNRVNTIGAFQSIFSRRPYLMSRFNSKNFESHLRKCLQNNHDTVVLEHLYLCQYIDVIRQWSKAKIILRTQNVETEIWTGLLPMQKGFRALFLKNDLRKLLKIETQIGAQLDGLICLTKRDQEFFKQYQPKLKSLILPVTSIEAFQFPERVSNVFYHVGSMDWRPNLEGINWLINEVIPKLSTSQIIINLAGKKMPDDLIEKSSTGLRIEGEIESISEFIENKGILLVPLRTGGGMRVKIIEALSQGKAVISTSKGAEGLGLEHNEHLLIADSPEDFSKSIELLYRDERCRERLAKNGYEFVEKNFSNESQIKKLTSFLESTQ